MKIINLELISDIMWPNGYIEKYHIKNAIQRIKQQQQQEKEEKEEKEKEDIQFNIYRVPFFLEPDYIIKPNNFWESHDTRMIRKFGSKEAFERVKIQHRLVPRAMEAGLTESFGFTEENLSKRKQSSTLNAHRLIQYVTKVLLFCHYFI